MSLLSNLNDEIKIAMKSKDNLKLESLRAIKAAVLLHQTGKGGGNIPSYEEEIKILQRLVKQRKESASIFYDKGRNDLADNEKAQASIISSFLPEKMWLPNIGFGQFPGVLQGLGSSSRLVGIISTYPGIPPTHWYRDIAKNCMGMLFSVYGSFQ